MIVLKDHLETGLMKPPKMMLQSKFNAATVTYGIRELVIVVLCVGFHTTFLLYREDITEERTIQSKISS